MMMSSQYSTTTTSPNRETIAKIYYAQHHQAQQSPPHHQAQDLRAQQSPLPQPNEQHVQAPDLSMFMPRDPRLRRLLQPPMRQTASRSPQRTTETKSTSDLLPLLLHLRRQQRHMLHAQEQQQNTLNMAFNLINAMYKEIVRDRRHHR